ncbi:MAG: hypothetical protein ACJ8AW_46425 [Rhodopila sp.]
MKYAVLLTACVGFASAVAVTPAEAWMRGYSGGGYTHAGDVGGWEHSTTMTSQGVSHSSNYGGYDHSTQWGAGGVAHESNAGGYWHGSAADANGAYHGSDYGGYYHSTATGVTVRSTPATTARRPPPTRPITISRPR